jgi:hypothetical protein
MYLAGCPTCVLFTGGQRASCGSLRQVANLSPAGTPASSPVRSAGSKSNALFYRSAEGRPSIQIALTSIPIRNIVLFKVS